MAAREQRKSGRMTEPAVVVLDYGCGNLAAIARMCERIGHRCEIVPSVEGVAGARRVIIPGVGAFDHGMTQLRERGFVDAVAERLKAGVPVLGICLGMQLLCRSSEEGVLPGLGWMAADVKRFRLEQGSPLKVPHMGWSELAIARDNALLPLDAGLQRFYFVHSYHVVSDNPQDVIARAQHGYDFVAGFQRDNLYGVQFHPEKSHRFGMALLKRFLEL
jgi:imidazole glycerol-phosphate synthase subunit HisH